MFSPLDAAPEQCEPVLEQVVEREEAAAEEQTEVAAKVSYEVVLIVAQVLGDLIVPEMRGILVHFIPNFWLN